MKLKLVVHKHKGLYYCNRCFDDQKILVGEIVFTVEKDPITLATLNIAEVEAKKKARSLGLPHVINLD